MKKGKTLILLTLIISSILMFFAANNTSSGYAFFDSTSVGDSTTSIQISGRFHQSSLYFNSNGGSNVTTLRGYTYDSLSIPEAPTKNNYHFIGWYSDINLTNEYEFIEFGFYDITLYAKWEIDLHTITFDSRGGSNVASITQAYGSAVSAPTNPTRSGFDFMGWYSDIQRTQYYQFSTIPNTNITLYAEWGTTGLVYSSISGGYSVSGGSANVSNVVIPNSYLGSPILKIDNNAFKGFKNIVSINIPTTVVEIGGSAFQNCSNLKDIFIPLSVTKMGYSVFLGCGKLTIYTEVSSRPSGWPLWVWYLGSKNVVWGNA